MRTNDAISGLILIAASLFMIYLTLDFPDFPGQKYGPALFPRILGAALILCGGILIVRGLSARRVGGPWVELADWTRDPRRLASFVMLPVLVLVYILISDQIGFIPLAFGILLLLFLWFGTRVVLAVPIAAIATWVMYWFFAEMLRVPLPRGILNNIL